MKIVLIGNYVPDRQESMQRYTASLCRALKDSGEQVSIVHPAPLLGKLLPSHRIAKYLAYFDKFLISLPVVLWRSRKADVVHICDHSNAIYTFLFRTKPCVVTCHDVLAIGAAKGLYKQASVSLLGHLLQAIIAAGLRRAHSVVCVSNETARALQRHVLKMSTTPLVIYNFLNWPYCPASASDVASVRKQLGLECQYFIHVGGNSWYKNRLGVLRIFSTLKQDPQMRELKLVMAGKAPTKEMLSYIGTIGLEHEVIFMQSPRNEDLAALYTGAVALIFPSLAEGFGWPIIEAQACGCPVITSGREPMVEVAGSGALFIDPEREAEAAENILAALASLPSLRAAGFANVSRFDTRKLVSSYSTVYRSVAGLNR